MAGKQGQIASEKGTPGEAYKKLLKGENAMTLVIVTSILAAAAVTIAAIACR